MMSSSAAVPAVRAQRTQGPTLTSEPTHIAVVGAGFVGTGTAFAALCRNAGARVTLTDVVLPKVEGEVLDMEDSGECVDVATQQEAGQADVIVITAGRGQRPGETRLDLLKANASIMRSVIAGMQPIKKTAKIVVVSNPCDPLTYQAQLCSGLPPCQVFGSGTVLDSNRLRVDLAAKLDVHHASIVLFVLGEHGDTQFPVPSLAKVGGVPLMDHPGMKDVDLDEISKRTTRKAYDIISRKGYTAFGVATACINIVDCVLADRKEVMTVSVRVPGRNCCLSLPAVVGINGIERILDVEAHFSAKERERYEASVERMEQVVGCL